MEVCPSGVGCFFAPGLVIEYAIRIDLTFEARQGSFPRRSGPLLSVRSLRPRSKCCQTSLHGSLRWRASLVAIGLLIHIVPSARRTGRVWRRADAHKHLIKLVALQHVEHQWMCQTAEGATVLCYVWRRAG